MTNKEYLDALANDDPRKLAQWFDEEHVDANVLEARIMGLQLAVERLRHKIGIATEVLQ